MSKLRKAAWTFCLLSAVAGCGKAPAAKPDPALQAYDVEADWNDPQKMIYLGYREAQGKRIFYQQCVWCHADATPAGPSNRSNVTPVPPLYSIKSLWASGIFRRLNFIMNQMTH